MDGFTLNGERYSYQRKCHAPDSERRVEMPIISKLLQQHKGNRILEIGNVMHRITSVKRDVVDLHERGCINSDITDYTPPHLYDLIVSISTLEHIGYKDNMHRAVKAAQRLPELLAKNGRLAVTWPLAYNHTLDYAAFSGRLPFTPFYMKRVNRENEWRQAPLREVENTQYNRPYPSANAIIVGMN